MPFRPEAIDLARVAGELIRVFAGSPPTGYVLGKTALRDVVTNLLSCSQLEAEEVVDTMISRGLLKYEGTPSQEIDDLRSWWVAMPTPAP